MSDSTALPGVSPKAWACLTAFQQQVYRAIAAIPPGQVRSYGCVARRIGRPTSARAVGSALHRNPCLRRACGCTRQRGRQAFTLCIPCHRVVRADGTLGGYAGGLAQKRRLLRQDGWTGRVNGA